MSLLAVGGHVQGGLPNWAYFVLVGLILVLVIFRQVRPRRATARGLFLVPGVITVVGLATIGQAFAHGVTSTDVLLLAFDAVVAVGLGLVRGATVRVWEQDGVAYMRGRWTTLVAWLVLIAARVGLVVLSQAMHSTVLENQNLLLVLLGVTLLAQSLLVAARMQRAGLSLAIGSTQGPRQGVWGR